MLRLCNSMKTQKVFNLIEPLDGVNGDDNQAEEEVADRQMHDIEVRRVAAGALSGSSLRFYEALKRTQKVIL